MSYFENERDAFELTKARWRAPQLGAIGSLLAHWTLHPDEPALVSLPTGAGKTGVALAAPFVTPTPPKRVLVLVPSTALREQTVRQYESMRLLREIGALTRWYEPARIRVHAVQGTSTDWDAMSEMDVVVAIPQSISPTNSARVSIPPRDLFDLVIVDEAHHLPSATWRGVLAHLNVAASLFLTATPFRLDRKPVPGTRTFYFPLRQAISEGFYKAIRPMVLPRPASNDISARDALIAGEIARLMAMPDHATSTLMVRAQDVERANSLASRYSALGIDIDVLTSRLTDANQTKIIRRLISGELRAVAVVGMLGEGFDLPRLRLAAYHDKHKSMPATVQLIGRLARVSESFPQESVLVTVDDLDVYPELQGVVRDLYREDSDWATILPGIVDAEVVAEQLNAAFVEALDELEGEIDPVALRPMPGPTIYEVNEPSWNPLGVERRLPAALHVGEVVANAVILTSFASDDGSLIALVWRRRSIPAWSGDLGLEEVEYGLSIVSYRRAPRTDLPDFLFVDADDARIHAALVDVLAVPASRRVTSSQRLDGYLQSLDRTSVSSIGMRNILAGTSGTSYKTRAGRSTDSDLLSVETAQTSLGHVMMQTNTPTGSTTVGAAFEKGKVWQRSYKPLIEYSEWISEAAQLLWFPRVGSSSQLLPQISRGRELERWPASEPIAVEPNPAVVVGGYQVFNDDGLVANLEDFDLYAGADPTGALDLPAHTETDLPVVGVVNDRQNQTSTVQWTATLHPNGRVQPMGSDLTVRRGYSTVASLSEFLEDYPPLIYFLNGQATQGHELFDVQGGSAAQYDPRSIIHYDWSAAGVDITAETRATALRHAAGISIHEGLESYLLGQPKSERFRWILCNDGAGEIADYVVVEWSRGRSVRLGLWHAKAAGGAPGLRVHDFEVVVSQAIRSRARFNDPALWEELRRRLVGESAPAATLVVGSDSRARLLVLLGQRRGTRRARRASWTTTRPLVQGEIAIVQPGLSHNALASSPQSTSGATATSLHQLFGIVADTVAVTGNRAIVLGSP